MIGRSVWVVCDGSPDELCDEEVALMGADATPARVRAEARRRGWGRTGELDLCPEHKEAE